MSLSLLLPPIIAAGGVYFTVKLRRIVLHPVASLRRAAQEDGGVRRAAIPFLLALSGTMGVGNIVGVIAAIRAAGAGSVLWMIISGAFAAILKYAEAALSCSTGGGIGILKAIKRALGSRACRIYTVLCIMLSLTMGSALQASAIRGAAEGLGAKISPIGIPVLALLVAITLFGKRWIMRASAAITPLAMLIYTALCLLVILPRISLLPSVISRVFKEALTPRAAAGGIGGFFISSGIREGFSCGLLSNEAGAGTSAFAHTSDGCESAHKAGICGYLEVVFDTLIFCTLTAVTVLIAGLEGDGCTLPALARVMNGALPYAGAPLLLGCCIAFALAAAICWFYYGTVCCEQIFGKRARPLFYTVFFIAFASGLIFRMAYLLPLTDAILLFLCIISISTLIKSSAAIVNAAET